LKVIVETFDGDEALETSDTLRASEVGDPHAAFAQGEEFTHLEAGNSRIH
jgi:hypothetical protein